MEQPGGEMEFTVRVEVLGHPHQVGGETLGTDVIEPMQSIGTFSDDA
jgi:hypothetical protein